MVHKSESQRDAGVMLGAGAWYQQGLMMLLAFWARLRVPALQAEQVNSDGSCLPAGTAVTAWQDVS